MDLSIILLAICSLALCLQNTWIGKGDYIDYLSLESPDIQLCHQQIKLILGEELRWSRTFKRRVNSTKQLLNAGRGHQASRKAAHCLRKEVGKNIKDKKGDKRGRDGALS